MKIRKLQAEWCGPCKQLTKWMSGIDFPYEVEVVDIDDNPEIGQEYGIRGIPAIVLVDDKDKAIKTAVGADPAKEFLLELAG